MSLNLYFDFSPWFPVQTPTEVSVAAYDAGSKKGLGLEADLATLKYVEEWFTSKYGPRSLSGKDSRNPYLLSQVVLEKKQIRSAFEKAEHLLLERAPYADRRIRVG